MDLNTVPLELDVKMLLRLLVAVVLSALVGYERERAGKPAGVRTHGMVSLDAALFAVLSLNGFGNVGDPPAWWNRSSSALASSAQARSCTSAAASMG